MLILFLLLSLVRLLRGAPTIAAATEGNPDILSGVDLLPRHGIAFGTRSTSDIVTSCLATIFACTWTAIHPNIPSPADSRFNIFKRQLVTTACALLAPELIALWAFRQYLGAKRIADEYNTDIANQTINQRNPSGYSVVDNKNRRSCSLSCKICGNFKEWLFDPPPFYPIGEGQIRPWTITHGFFVQMGGFMLCDDGRPIQTLSFKALKDKISDNTIKPPKISEAEIGDRSKGDVISKTVVILQTTWFISQCIARWSIGIPVTELEILTLGFAMLNGLTYALWWNKPQNVGVPVFLEMKALQSASSQSEMELTSEIDSPNHYVGDKKPLEPMQFTKEQRNKKSFSSHFELRNGIDVEEEFWPMSLVLFICEIFLIPFLAIQVLISAILESLGKLLAIPVFSNDEPPAWGDLRVPMFWSEAGIKYMDNVKIAIFLFIIATLFGCIHLVPSFFLLHSSSKAMSLWKISAAFITLAPLCSALVIYGNYQEESLWSKSNAWIHIVETMFYTLFSLATILYPVARVTLIILALVSLRTLPQDAHLTIDWISSIPHV